MRDKIRSIRGMNDHLPKYTALCHRIELVLQDVLVSYGYNEIRLPIIEHTSLFIRAIGEHTDVIAKEMYTFQDKKGNSLTLRPEGTASCVRAGIEHGLLHNQEQRFWYIGSMFRYERPQKGRYRQFDQIGAEVFGQKGPDVDAELILLTARWWKMLGISKYIRLEINSIGSLTDRMRYQEDLVAFLMRYKDYLDNDSLRRLYTNPMRIFDSKNREIQILLNDAPTFTTDYLDNDAKIHFSNLCQLLNLANISYKINPRLVRGLDYYNKTVFEWITTSLGAQGTVCGGGRYDNLVKQLGGYSTPAIGFAMGLERLVLLVQAVNPKFIVVQRTDIYLISSVNNMQGLALGLAEQLRNILPTLRLMIHYGGGSLKNQLSRANKHGARIALIIMENNQLVKRQVILKDLSTGNQEILIQNDVVARLSTIFNKKHDKNN